jgi:adenylate cyclase
MVSVVFDHGGTLDKFIGDALLAVWGAPLAGADDASGALAAAREMHRRSGILNIEWRTAGRPALEIGIGIHSGEAFAGTIGSPQRLEYTVIGDVVNVASRLCRAAGPGEILLSDAVAGQIRNGGFGAPEPLDLRGRAGPVMIHRLVVSNG